MTTEKIYAVMETMMTKMEEMSNNINKLQEEIGYLRNEVSHNAGMYGDNISKCRLYSRMDVLNWLNNHLSLDTHFGKWLEECLPTQDHFTTFCFNNYFESYEIMLNELIHKPIDVYQNNKEQPPILCLKNRTVELYIYIEKIDRATGEIIPDEYEWVLMNDESLKEIFNHLHWGLGKQLIVWKNMNIESINDEENTEGYEDYVRRMNRLRPKRIMTGQQMFLKLKTILMNCLKTSVTEFIEMNAQ